MKHLFTIFLLFSSVQLWSQDYILFKNGEEVRVKVQEITPTEVKYKKHNNLQGPTYSVLKKDIDVIQYENGDRERFNSTPATRQGTTQRQPNRNDNDGGSSGEVGIKFGGLYKLGLEIYTADAIVYDSRFFIVNDLSLGFKTKYYQFGIGTGLYYKSMTSAFIDDESIMLIPFYVANRGYIPLPNSRVTPLAYFDIGFIPFAGGSYDGEIEFETIDSDYWIVPLSVGTGVAFGQKRTFQVELGYKALIIPDGDNFDLFRIGLVAAF